MKLVEASQMLNPFDEARAYLDEWEKAEPDAKHVILILDGRDVLTYIAGSTIRPSDAAGLCFTAAHMVLED